MRTLCLVLVLLGFAPQDKGARKLEWKLPPGHVAEFTWLDKAGKPLPDPRLQIFGSELTPGSNRIAIDTYAQIPVALIFQLPPEAMKAGLGWEHNSYFFNDAYDALGGLEALQGGSIKPVCAKGRYIAKIAKKGDDEIATIEGALSLFEVRRDMVNSALKVTVSKIELGTLATSAQFSLSKGMILKAGWQYRAKAQDREAGRVVEKKIETHSMIEFKEDVELDAAKIQPLVDTAVTRAVEWLKKQQKGGAWTASKPVDTTYQTSVVVRALAAAGLKADDPALVAASRTLRTPPPPETFTLCQQILALTGKGPTPEELDDARRFADELNKRRDARSGGWAAAATGRNDVPTAFLTAFALEALASVPDSKVPEETLKSGLEYFSGNWVEEDGKIDLELEFEKGATTIAPEPKKDVVPAGWPQVVGRGAADMLRTARKGSFFTTVAALRVLLLLPERLKADERQLKTLDLPLRKGLASLQFRWTLRSVPPIEAAWCVQRMEYLGMLGPTLAKAKVDKIAGSDWRLEGASLLLREQGDDGSWFPGTDQAIAKTAHALLFLSSVKR
jgi:hypothetical protein